MEQCSVLEFLFCWEAMKSGKVLEFISGLYHEPFGPSLTRVIITAAFLLFTGVTLFLVIKGMSWEHYDTFALVAGGGSICGQVGNKFVNNKWPQTQERGL